MSEKPVVACKRCKAKKLKCDDDPNSCENCTIAAVTCTNIDSRSRREYIRGYVEKLQNRIEHLRNSLHATDSSDVMGCIQVPAATTPSISPVTEATYQGEGSIVSIARLVEAAVTPLVSNTSILATEVETTREREQAELAVVRAIPASLPPLAIARQLFTSYLTGPHLLHPFLRRSDMIAELDTIYSQPGSQSGQLMFRLYMIFAIGAVSLVRAGVHPTPAINYFATAMEHSHNAMGPNGLEHAQALLLVLLFSLQHDIGVGSKWDLARVAMRICIENRFHVKARRNVQPMVDQMQRRVFWACYISDRQSSSVLGRPMAIQDEDIDAELPTDADDDLIESGHEDLQILRGMSEVSVQLRQIHLRQLTSKISTELYRDAPHRPYYELETATEKILFNLDQWREEFPILVEPDNAYETLHWRDLNYYRERLKCFRLAILLGKESPTPGTNALTSLESCQQAAAQVARLYREMRASDKLVLNWTCVHDMMSAGFTMLFCGIAQQEAIHRSLLLADVGNEWLPQIRDTT